jgi:hypothetical protein
VLVLIQNDNGVPSVAIILSLLLVVFSFVFWKVDSRNRELINLSEEALEYFEEKSSIADGDGNPHRSKLYSR